MLIAFAAEVALAGPLMVAGSPSYDPATDVGFQGCGVSAVNNSGVAVGRTGQFVGGRHSYVGNRPVRFDATGTATVLETLLVDSSHQPSSEALAINDAGTAVGYSDKYEDGEDRGASAVRWDASSTIVIELDGLGGGSRGAYAINNAGTAVGSAVKYVDGARKGSRAVRWDASGTAATELGILSTDDRDWSDASAVAVNDAGMAVGSAVKYVDGVYLGSRAVRWDASGTAATELEPLSTASDGFAYAGAVAVNAAGTTIGFSGTLNPAHIPHTDERAVRWDAFGTVGTALDSLGTDSLGHAHCAALAINDAGTAVGWAGKSDGEPRGRYAVRWEVSGTAVTELENLGVNRQGLVMAAARAINSAGTVVGSAVTYINGHDEEHAVIWRPDGSIIDLNDLGVVPVSGAGMWMLDNATAISDDGWVAGSGAFLRDGDAIGYSRGWVTQVGLGGTWTNAGGGVWGRGPNWSTGTPAMQVGDATFDLDSGYTVALDRDERTQAIGVDAGTVTIELNGHTLGSESSVTIAHGATLTVAGPGGLLLDVNNGASGQILGDGTIDLDATLVLDVADLPVGGDWSIFATGTLTGSFGSGFDVEFLTDSGRFAASETASGVWTCNVPSLGIAVFSEATGVLSVVPEPGMPSIFAGAILCLCPYVWRRKWRMRDRASPSKSG